MKEIKLFLMILTLMVYVMSGCQLIQPKTPENQLAKPVAKLEDLFRLDSPKTAIVIAIDVSGSMTNLYPEIRQSIIDFAPTLTNNDDVFIFRFAEVVSAPQIRGNGTQIAGIISTLPEKLTNDSGTRTDLGIALDTGIRFLEQSNAPVKAFLLITDGYHQPANPYYSKDFGDSNWQKLQRRAENLCAKNPAFVYGVVLKKETDIQVLTKIFSPQSVQVIDGKTSTQFPLALKQLREDSRRASLQKAIEGELEQGKIESILSHPQLLKEKNQYQATLTLRNQYHRLPVQISEIQITGQSSSQDISGQIETGFKPLVLKPSEEWRGQIVCSTSFTGAFRIGRIKKVLEDKFTIVPACQFVNQSDLNTYGFSNKKVTSPASQLPVAITVSYGIPWSWVGLAAIFIAVFVIIIYETREKKIIEAKQLKKKRETSYWFSGIFLVDGQTRISQNKQLEDFQSSRLWLVKREGQLDVVVSLDDQAEKIAELITAEIEINDKKMAKGKGNYKLEIQYRIKPTNPSRLEYKPGLNDPFNKVDSTFTIYDKDTFRVDGTLIFTYRNHNCPTRSQKNLQDTKLSNKER